jgi:hypothetical protein
MATTYAINTGRYDFPNVVDPEWWLKPCEEHSLNKLMTNVIDSSED